MATTEIKYDDLKQHEDPIADLVGAWGNYNAALSLPNKEFLELTARRILLNPHYIKNKDKFDFITEDLKKLLL